MLKAEAELKAQIEALLNKARARLEQRQREADRARGRSEDDDQKPRGCIGCKPSGNSSAWR